ncbi:hypothetical protein [Natrinema sp. 74]|uniref:hypothetical protein n=1 Tax=Natrinema sp. 74 TaxID=3384159 RepID=UPI0038D461E5
MVSSIVIYEPDDSIDTSDLYNKLNSSYEHERPHQELDTLKTDISSLAHVSRGVECRVRYDTADSVRVRGGTEPVRNLSTAQVRFTSDYVFFLDYNRRSFVEREVRKILDLDTDEFNQVRFSSGLVIDVTEEDSDTIEEGYWNNPTDHTTTASLYGDIDDSSLAARFNQNGQPTYAKFESEHFDGSEVGVSANKSSIAFWGDRSRDEQVNYFYNIVEPLV